MRLATAILIAIFALGAGQAIAAPSGSTPMISFGRAKHELSVYAGFSCPTTECKHRTYGCRRRSALRVECRSEFVEDWKEDSPTGKTVLRRRELCRWTGVATPFHGSTSKLKLSTRHYRCRRLGPDEGGFGR